MREHAGRVEVAGVWLRAPGTRPCLLARGGKRQEAPGGLASELGRLQVGGSGYSSLSLISCFLLFCRL